MSSSLRRSIDQLKFAPSPLRLSGFQGLSAAICLLTMVLDFSSSLATAAERSFSVPILCVSTTEPTGSCLLVNFTYSRDAADTKPLKVAVSEDTPGGAGPSFRAGVWMAAMVAALDRNDALTGVQIGIEIPGAIDGPSAGAAVCLSLLSALDGTEFPSDCAITGIVMPDGTIGDVGGIAIKMRAAAAHGIKRIMAPAYLRFERDKTTGEDLDLKRLATSLSIQFIPVENVSQAYHLLHRRDPQAPLAAERAALELSAATEDVLKARYQNSLAEGSKAWEAISETDRKQIAEAPYFKKRLIDSRDKAERAYRSGRFLYAANEMRSWLRFLAARRANEQDLSDKSFTEPLTALEPGDFDGFHKLFDAKLTEIVNKIPVTEQLLDSGRQMGSGSAAQFGFDLPQIRGTLGISVQIQLAVDETMAGLADPALTAEQRMAELESLIGMKALQLLLARDAFAATEAWAADVELIADTLQVQAEQSGAAAVERLFYSSYLAAHNTFHNDVIRVIADERELSSAQALQAMVARDTSLASYLPTGEIGTLLHRHADRIEPSFVPFDAAFSAHAQAGNLAAVSGLIARWNFLDAAPTEQGRFYYQRTDLLNYLLTSARATALVNLGECRRRKIECIQPILYFETAELTRDDPDTDKVDVLTNYWNASLQAKVLLMLRHAPQP